MRPWLVMTLIGMFASKAWRIRMFWPSAEAGRAGEARGKRREKATASSRARRVVSIVPRERHRALPGADPSRPARGSLAGGARWWYECAGAISDLHERTK